jgi:hypothetical protein
MQFNLVRRDGDANITVVIDGNLYVADDQHPQFEKIVEAVLNDAPENEVLSLIDASVTAGIKFQELSDRVVVRNSRVYVDQTEVDGAFADLVVRFLAEDQGDWAPLVKFLEKTHSNIDDDVRENLGRWLNAEAFSLLPNGNILGYRGLNKDYTSKHAGPGIVNGVAVNGHLDNSVGNVLEIDADLVERNAARGCASGLHVGTYDYATSWAGGGPVVSVEVDPRHVRSVPYECDSSKMRVSKYVVLDTVTSKTEGAVNTDFVVDDSDEFGDGAVSADYVEGYIDGYDDGDLGLDSKF